MIKELKTNVYTDVSREVASEKGVSSNPVTRGLNDSGDALRHAYSSGIMAYRYGSPISEVFGDLNEKKNRVADKANDFSSLGDGYIRAVSAMSGKTNEEVDLATAKPVSKVKPEEEWMDYYNNQKGREIAAQVKARGGSEQDVEAEVAKAVSNNELVLTPFDPRRTYDEHGDFEQAVKDSEQQMMTSWNRDLAEISNDPAMSSADKQEARRKLDERYQEYERQFNQQVEQARLKKGGR